MADEDDNELEPLRNQRTVPTPSLEPGSRGVTSVATVRTNVLTPQFSKLSILSNIPTILINLPGTIISFFFSKNIGLNRGNTRGHQKRLRHGLGGSKNP